MATFLSSLVPSCLRCRYAVNLHVFIRAVDFLTKPFDVEALFDAVRQALARA